MCHMIDQILDHRVAYYNFQKLKSRYFFSEKLDFKHYHQGRKKEGHIEQMVSVGDHRSFSELIFKFLFDGLLLYLRSFNLTLIVSLHFQTQNAQNISVLPSPPQDEALHVSYGKHFSSNVIRFTSKELLPSFLN